MPTAITTKYLGPTNFRGTRVSAGAKSALTSKKETGLMTTRENGLLIASKWALTCLKESLPAHASDLSDFQQCRATLELAIQAYSTENAPAPDNRETLESEGWSVTDSVWDAGSGKHGLSYYYTNASGERSSDDYATEAEAWAGAWAKFRDTRQTRPGKFEGERGAVREAYDSALEGFADEEFGEVDEGGYYARVDINESVFLVVNSDGFVSEITADQFAAARADYDATADEEEPGE